MKKLLLTAALTAGLCASNALAQKQGQRDPDVDKALERAYPKAEQEILGVETVNGVKVFNVQIRGKDGQSSARVTEHGDFLTYGSAQQSEALSQMLAKNAGGLFKSTPKDIELHRSTNYFIDVPAPAAKGKARQGQGANQDAPSEYGYRVRFDAVGRVLDIQNPDEVYAEYSAVSGEQVTDDALAKRITEQARQYIGEGEINGVFRATEEGYYVVDAKGIGTAAKINEEGRLLSYRREIKGDELPLPVRQAAENMFANPSRAFRGEDAYFQFQQQAQTGNEVTVRMRPNGDILEVNNDEAAQEARAAAAKQKGGKAQKKGGD